MKKDNLSILIVYFIILCMMVIVSIISCIDVIDNIFLIVICCSLLKFNLIVKENKK